MGFRFMNKSLLIYDIQTHQSTCKEIVFTSAWAAPARRLVREDFPTLGKPTNPIERSFLTRPNRAALIAPDTSSSLDFFLGGMVAKLLVIQ